MANELQIGIGGDSIQTFRDQMDRLFNQFLGLYGSNQTSSLGQQQSGSNQRASIIPTVEAIEDEKTYRITMDIPGVDPKNVEVNIAGNNLQIRAERRNEQQEQQQGHHILLAERNYGIVRREFRLPDDADRNRINAEFRHGVLALTIQKTQDTQQRKRIEIKTS